MPKKTRNPFRIFFFSMVIATIVLFFGIIYSSEIAKTATESLYPEQGSRTTSFGSSSYEPMEEIPGFGRPSSFYDYAISIYKFGIGAVGICAMLMIMIGGYMYMASAGNNASMEKAKGVITDAIVGLILALSSYLILYVINPDLTKIKEIKPIDTIAQDAATGVTGTTGDTSATKTKSGEGDSTVCGKIPSQVPGQCGDASPELNSLLSCVAEKVGKNNIQISSISDGNGGLNC